MKTTLIPQTEAKFGLATSLAATWLAVASLASVDAQAAVVDWTGGGGAGSNNWTHAANWSGDNTPPLSTDIARLTTGATYKTINIDAPQTVVNLLHPGNGGVYVVNGDRLTLASAATGTNAEALEIGGANTDLTFNNAVHFSGTPTAYIDLVWLSTSGYGYLTFNGPVTAAGNLVTVARGATTPSTAMLFNGDVTLNSGAGSLTLQTGGIPYTLAGNNSWSTLTVADTSTLKLASDGAIPSGSTLAASGGDLARTIRFEAVGAPRTYAANFTFNTRASDAPIIFQGDHGLAFTGNATLQRDAKIQVDGDITVAVTGNWTQPTGRYVVKTGTGTLVMGSTGKTMAYTGGTTVETGTLLINGNLTQPAGLKVVTVKIGGTLGGSGIVTGGTTTVEAGGTLAPGNSIGTLTVGDIGFEAGSRLLIELGNGIGDQLVVAGNLTVSGSATILEFVGGYSESPFLVFATATSYEFATVRYNGDDYTWAEAQEYHALGNYHLSIRPDGLYVIPEPASALLVMFGGLPVLRRCRRRGGGHAAEPTGADPNGQAGG